MVCTPHIGEPKIRKEVDVLGNIPDDGPVWITTGRVTDVLKMCTPLSARLSRLGR